LEGRGIGYYGISRWGIIELTEPALSRILFNMKSSINRSNTPEAFEKGMIFFTIAVALFIAVESGFLVLLPRWIHIAGNVMSALFIIAGLFEFFYYLFNAQSKAEYFRRNWWNLIFFVIIFSTLRSFEISRFIALVREVFFLMLLFSKRKFFRDFFSQPFVSNPTRLLAVSFVTIILVGAVLLMLPVSSENQQRTGFIDALFTATSATCVTGLIVKDTPNHWSTFGEIVILLLIQAGGIGIMTFSISIALVFGTKLGLREKKAMGEILELPSVGEVGKIVKSILRFTFAAEATGLVLLFFRWLPYFGNAKKAFYYSCFHSVSAFCNAGFSLFSTSLKDFVADPVINLVIMLLIIIGGIGFVVAFDLFQRGKFIREWRLRSPKLTVHTKLVVIMSIILIFSGFILFFIFEFDNVLIHQGIGGKIWASLFQSITPRTAGFNTVDTSALKDVTLFITIILMFIGASPGSTGGGIKTSTFAVLILAVVNMVRGRENLEIFHSTIPKRIVYKAVTIVVVAAFVIAIGTALLLITEKESLINVLFEATSAFGTVGLSTGVTFRLTGVGKIVVAFLIYIGRIGPLALAYAVGRYSKKYKREFPRARVMVG
jgi:trk system potassium uptake protein TrkH